MSGAEVIDAREIIEIIEPIEAIEIRGLDCLRLLYSGASRSRHRTLTTPATTSIAIKTAMSAKIARARFLLTTRQVRKLFSSR